MSKAPKVVQTPAPPDNSLELERMQQAERESNRAREEAAAATKLTNDRAAAANAWAGAETNARDRIYRAFADQGGDARNYMDVIDSAITGARGGISDTELNPGQYLNDTFVNDIVSGRLNAARTKNTQAVDNTYAPNWANDAFADTADDSIISSILGTQRGEAVAALDSARKRGNLDSTGYSAALAKLDQQQAAGNATAQQLGGNVLQGYRSGLSDLISGARTAAGQSNFGNFNMDSYNNNISNKLNSYNNSLAGDVTAALQGQEFFDIGSILNAGGTAQGGVNAAPNSVAIQEERDRQRQATRGLGGSGVF
jgi:hypothetical protein